MSPPPPHRSEGTQLPSSPRASPEPHTKSSEPEDGETRAPEPPREGAWGSDSRLASRPPDQGLSRTRRAPSALMPPSGLQTEPHPLPAEAGLPRPLGSPTPAGLRADALPGGWAPGRRAPAQGAKRVSCQCRAGVGRAPREPEWEQAPRHHRCAGRAGWSPREGHREALHVENLGLLGVQPQEQRRAERRCLSRRPRALPAGLQAGVGRLQVPALSHDFRGPVLPRPGVPGQL